MAASYIKDEIRKARQSSRGLIIRQKDPKNLETPFDEIDSFLTPTELFYIRSHFAVPKLEFGSYQLRIEGAVRSPFCLSYQELRGMPFETRVAVLECAGNRFVARAVDARCACACEGFLNKTLVAALVTRMQSEEAVCRW